MADQNQEKLYFANRTGKALGEALLEKKRTYERFVEQAGLVRVWRKMHWRFYGAHPETGHSDQEVGRDGEEGELHLLLMNHLRADVTIWLNLAFSQRTEMEPEAAADDYEAELEVKRAKAALEHFTQQADIDKKEREAGEFAGIYGMSFIMRWWNRNRGEVALPPEELEPVETDVDSMEPPGDELAEQQAAQPPGQPIREGALEAFALTPMDVFSDPFRRSGSESWYICRVFRNRHDMMAEYPALAEKIRDFAAEDENDTRNITQRVDLLGVARAGEGKSGQRDEVPVYYFFHPDTPAVPGGRCVVFLDPDIVLEDFQLDKVYQSPPVKRLACAEIHRTPFGYSPAWGLLAPQEAQASLSSIALSNARTFGLGVVIAPKGSDIDDQDLGQGLRLVEYTPGLDAPKALQLPQTPQEVFAFRGALIAEMGQLVGVNSVVRGDPEASLKSGSALALVQAQAVQYSSDFQANIVVWKERHHFDTISIAQMNLRAELEPKIAGNYQAALLKAFTGSDFKKIRKVRIREVNPMSKTLAGRVQIADTLVERFPNVLTPGDYFRVLETGSIEYLTRGQTQRRAALDRENELLASGIGPPKMGPVINPDGTPAVEMGPMGPTPAMAPQIVPGQRYVRALITDDHRAHVLKHLEVLDNPAVRESSSPEAQAVLNAVLDHVEEHEQLAIAATQTRLALLELTNQPPLQSALPPPPPAASDGAPPKKGPAGGGGEASGGGGEGGSAAAPMQPAPPGANQQPRQPQMPINPSTGQRVEEVPGP